jgi:hypothetical protein
MIEMLVVACLTGQPNACREWSLGISDAGLMSCLIQSQPQAAQWSEQHPRWTVRRVSCKPVSMGRDA